MKHDLRQITWLAEDAEKQKQAYLETVIEILEAIDFRFSLSMANPITTAKQYLSGEISEKEYIELKKEWAIYFGFRHLFDRGGRKTFEAQLDGFLNCNPEDPLEHLEWFCVRLDYMGFYSEKVDAVIASKIN